MALPVTTSTAPAPFNPVTSSSALSILPTTSGTGAVAPDLGITAGSAPGSGSLTQGTALPNITTTQKQATATPQFYTDYLTNIAKNGAIVAKGAEFAGAQPLQEKAFANVESNVGNYLPTPTPVSLTIANRNDAAGTFTLIIDDTAWGLISSDPELNIAVEDCVCFTGRIKLSFPAVTPTPAEDNIIFLMFLVRSDGVVVV